MVTMEVEYFNLDGKTDQSLEWITKLIHHHQDYICILEIWEVIDLGMHLGEDTKKNHREAKASLCTLYIKKTNKD